VKEDRRKKKQRNKDTKYKRIHEVERTKKSRNIKEKTKLKLNQNGSKWKGRGMRSGNPLRAYTTFTMKRDGGGGGGGGGVPGTSPIHHPPLHL
jgi:hypothetical protein